MGSSCSNVDDVNQTNRLLQRNIEDDEKINTEPDGSSTTALEQHNTAEINAMAKEVILLSTRNANLQQELDETNEQIVKLKKQIDTNLDINDDNNLCIDILKLCKILNINVSSQNIIINNNKKEEEINILFDFLNIEPEDIDDNKDEYKYFNTFNKNKQLYLLLCYLKSQNDTININKIIIMQLFKSYYYIHNENNNNKEDIKQIYNLCNKLNVSSQTINKIHEIIKQEINLQNQYENEIFV